MKIWHKLCAYFIALRLDIIPHGMYKYQHYTKAYIVTRSKYNSMDVIIIYRYNKRSMYQLGDLIHMTNKEALNIENFKEKY
jgi:hypothetical protein